MPDESDDDAVVVQQVLAGHVAAFATLVRRYERPIHCMAANLLRRSDCIDDIAQEVFLAAYRNLSTFDPNRAAFSTWLLTICKNKCLAELRRAQPVALDQIAEPVAEQSSADPLSEQELFLQLNRALAELPFDQRLVFVLAGLMDMSCEQIAAIEQTPAGTIRSRLTRARQTLQSALKEFAGETP